MPAWMERLAGTTAAASAFLTLLLAIGCSADAAQAKEPPKPLSLEEAFARAEAADPSLLAADARLEASKAAERQADALPNPSIGLEVENFGGSGPNRSLNSAETTLAIEQTVELGGKREARRRLAQREGDAARIRREITRLDLFLNVEQAWVEALAADANVQLAVERLSVAERLRSEVAHRVRAARDPLFATARAEAEAAAARVALSKAQSDAKAARAALASWWQGSVDFTLDPASFERAASRTAGGAPGSAPALVVDEAALVAERDVARANIDIERSRAVQDPSFSLGVRHFSEDEDYALVLGASVPLPLFDTNEANIDRAAAESSAAEYQLDAARRERVRQITQLEARLANEAAAAETLKEQVIPQAERAVRLLRDGFKRGSFGYLDLIEAQRALLDAREQRIEALKAYHLNHAALDRLTGVHATPHAREDSR